MHENNFRTDFSGHAPRRSEKPSLVNSAILEYQPRHLVGVLSCCFVRLTWPKRPYGRHLQLSKIHWRPEFCSNLTWPEDPVTSREWRAWRHVTFGGKTRSFLWFSSIATQICVTFTLIKRYSKPMMMQFSKYLKLQMADESVHHRHWVSGQRCASRRCHTASTRSTGNAYVCGLGNTWVLAIMWCLLGSDRLCTESLMGGYSRVAISRSSQHPSQVPGIHRSELRKSPHYILFGSHTGVVPHLKYLLS